MGYLPIYGYNIYSWVLLIAAVVIAGIAQGRVKNAFQYYSQIPVKRGYSASQAALTILHQNGIYDVSIEMGNGTLTDHYNPKTKQIKLSPDVYQSSSIASVAIAAHEVGHAIQHNQRYALLSVRHVLVPVTNIANYLSFPLILLGIFMSYPLFVDIGIYAFLITVVFQLVTLPVEYNASHRAQSALLATGIITEDEATGVHRMLNAAALTYVAATIVAFLNLLRLLLISRRRQG